jgi:periodic tryptophan protein 2
MQGTIEGRRDMAGGKVIGDLRSATAKASKSFKTLAYSADGAVLLGGGNGKYVCMYDVDGRALLKKFPLSKSKALDGTIERLDSNRVTDAGPMDLLPASDSEDDDEGFRRGDRGRGGAGSGGPGGSLPGAGAWNGAGSSRSSGLDVKKRPVIRCKHVTFAPTGQGWAASTTEGVMVFTRDTGAAFDPTDLGEDVTPSAARRALRHGDARLALLMSLRLKGADDDESLVAETLERVAPDAVASALRDFPTSLLAPLLESLAERVTKGPHAHLMLRWTRELCVAHGRAIHSAAHGGGGGAGALVGAAAGCDQRLLPALRRLSKAFANLHNDLEQTAEASVFLLDYVCAAPSASAKA